MPLSSRDLLPESMLMEIATPAMAFEPMGLTWRAANAAPAPAPTPLPEAEPPPAPMLEAEPPPAAESKPKRSPKSKGDSKKRGARSRKKPPGH
jgi:outer membrane biosynthesis protein TonB